MKHVGTDNLLLYALCVAATRLESLAKSGISAVRRVLGRAGDALEHPERTRDLKSSHSNKRLTKNRPLTSE